MCLNKSNSDNNDTYYWIYTYVNVCICKTHEHKSNIKKGETSIEFCKILIMYRSSKTLSTSHTSVYYQRKQVLIGLFPGTVWHQAILKDKAIPSFWYEWQSCLLLPMKFWAAKFRIPCYTNHSPCSHLPSDHNAPQDLKVKEITTTC